MSPVRFISSSVKGFFTNGLAKFQQLSPIQQKISGVVTVLFVLLAAIKLCPKIYKKIIDLSKPQKTPYGLLIDKAEIEFTNDPKKNEIIATIKNELGHDQGTKIDRVTMGPYFMDLTKEQEQVNETVAKFFGREGIQVLINESS